jgi:hypothetical protein
MDVRGLTKLRCSFGLDPALGGDPHAAHATHGGDQSRSAVGKKASASSPRAARSPFDRPVASRFEIKQHGTARAREPVCVVRASVQRPAPYP